MRTCLSQSILGLCVFLLVACDYHTPSSSSVAEPVQQVAVMAAQPLVDSLLQIAPPPPLGSPQLQQELAELQAIRAALTPDQRMVVAGWDAGAVLRWNVIARDLVARYESDPLNASRLYLVLSVAQYDALQASARLQQRYQRTMPAVADGGIAPLVTVRAVGSYPSEHAALAAAAVAVLSEFFPGSAAALAMAQAEEEESRLWAGTNCRSDLVAGEDVGRQIAQGLIARSRNEMSALKHWNVTPPTGSGKWVIDADDPLPPAAPEWGLLQPWLMQRPDQFRAPPPPAFDSPEFAAALKEVRTISDHRSDEQVRIATFWADGVGSATPPGHWNAIAATTIAASKMREEDAARTLAYLNMALYDAGIAAWDTKYAYWLIRPWQADTKIVVALKRRPNHPSYVSGHSTFSAAAATFLGAVFPDHEQEFSAMAEEASLSRVYAGIHYRFDGEAGLALGRSVGRLAIERWRDDR